MNTRECNICKEVKSLDDYYKQIKIRANGEKYLYYPPYCKSCTSNKSANWAKENRESKLESDRKYSSKPERRKYQKDKLKEYFAQGKYREWQRENKDKVKEYNMQHRNHNITEDEWHLCLEYFNFACAYCEMPEDKHLEVFNQQLHRDHVYHDGNNYYDNCVPACRTCNSSKRDYNFTDWYASNNSNYTAKRFHRIVKWMTVISIAN
ncbi:HNH endonuclease [Bacillus sp. FJAT-22090]|uniref:HNH endonuclease signature motif containing protein n=1 Tax=Bacillus sp. FJAT-22090 TaxID=1581038 RepID=UPI0011A43B4F|nr:HNH endonuclease [Bacillus sp. FJAT-22090]